MTFFKTLAVCGALLVVSTSAQAQTPPLTFDQAAYVTCREAQNMSSPRRARHWQSFLLSMLRDVGVSPFQTMSSGLSSPFLFAVAAPCPGRLSVHRHRPSDHGGAVEAAEAFIRLINFARTRQMNLGATGCCLQQRR